MKIMHISDLHFGMHRPDIIEAFLADTQDLKPDLILISGDLTQRALPEQYQELQHFLKQLSPPLLTVPGNHDIVLYNPIERFLYPFKRYKKYVSKELDAQFINEEVNVLGVNSVTPYKAKDGVLNQKAIDRIKYHFSCLPQRLNILFFHHNLNYFSGMHHPLNNAEEFIEYLKESPIHLVCTGHLHYANVKIITKNENEKCAILHAGSLSCQRSKDKMNSFYVLDVKQLNCAIEQRVYSNGSFSSQEVLELNFTA